MAHFQFESVDAKKLERDLRHVSSKAAVYAAREGLNNLAWEARRLYQEEMREKLVLRNRFTEGSVRVNRAGGLSLDGMRSEVGSVQEYMAEQESGSIQHSDGGGAIAIPTGYAAGQEGAVPRTKLPRGQNKMSAIRLTARSKRGRRAQKNAASLRMAQKAGSKFVYLETENKRGIFRLVGPTKSPKLKMVHDLTRSTITIPKNPMLGPALQRLKPRMGTIMVKAMLRQLRRNGLFVQRR